MKLLVTINTWVPH